MTARRTLLTLALVTALAATGCEQAQGKPGSGGRELVTAATTVDLTVAAPLPMTGYDRKRFGQPWKDIDGNGCDQRFDVLMRDAGSAAKDPRPGRCKVTAIMLTDPYSEPTRTLRSTADIEIDHVVPLAAAWRAGAARWTDAERERFANDPSNLLAVYDKLNQAKGDKTPDLWKPPRRGAWCDYSRIYIDVSRRYSLTVTQPTLDALIGMSATC